MTKIIMIIWIMSSSGEMSEPVQFEGWKSMSECETAAESFTEGNPKSKATYRYAAIAQCMTVPK